MKNVSNVLELSGSTFELVAIEPMCVLGGWIVRRDVLPSFLPKPLDGEFANLNIDLTLICSEEEKDWDDGMPFRAKLEIQPVDVMDRGEYVCRATRDLAIQHLWNRTQMRESITLCIPADRSSGMSDYNLSTFNGFYRSIVGSVLAGVIKTPKAVIRWDEQGLAVTVGFGATYISTREHYTDDD